MNQTNRQTAQSASLQAMDSNEQVAFLKSVLESSTEYSIVAKDLDGTILAWNEGARRNYGYEPTEVVGKASAFILHPIEDVESGHARSILDVALRKGKWEGELVRVRKDSSRFTAHVTITLRCDPAGQPIGFTMISRDVSESQRIERELRESQEYNRGLIESNIDALITTDPLGYISDVNKQMCAMTGRSREQLIGTQFKTYFTEPQRAEDGIRKVLAEDRVTNYELTMVDLEGKQTVVSYNATTFRAFSGDGAGRLRGVFAAARDITEQKRLEEDLRQAQNYTRSLIESSVDALITVDPQFRVTDVNEQSIRLTGFSREELVGSLFPDYFTDPEKASAGVQKTLTEGYVTDYVLVLRSRIGKETHVSFNASVFKDTGGNVKGIFAAARDITAPKRLEDELRQAQNYNRGLIESSVDPMITVDQDLLITDVNEQMVRLTEVPKDRLIGSLFDSYFTAPALAAAGVRKTLAEGYVTNYELTLQTPSGREVLVSFNASIFKDTEGKVRGVFAVARDVTEQRKLEERLREQQNYSRSLIEASVDGLVTVDPQGKITDVNEQMARMAGVNRTQLVGTSFADYFTDSQLASAGVRETFEKSIVTNYELTLRSKSGDDKRVSFNAAVYKDTAGQVAGIFAAARDITQQKSLERELREQQFYNRGLIESNIDALMTTDPLGIITDVNKQMCVVTGKNRDQLIGTPFKDFFTDPKRAEDGVRRVLAEGRVTDYELTAHGPDGKGAVVSYNATTFSDEAGRLKGVFAAARDISSQKRLEEQLRQAHNYNRGLIESSVDAMLTVDPDLTITDVNGQMVKLTGYERAQLIGSSFQDYFTEPERAANGVHRTLQESFVTNYELTLRSRHRRQILVSFNASVYKDTEGNTRGIFAVARDVTDERRLEEKIREQQHYNRSLIESSVDALVTVDPDFVVTDVNDQMIRLTGYSREELIGSLFKDYFTEPSRAVGGVRQTLAEGFVTNYELSLRAKNGKRTVVSFNAGTFKDMAGKVAGILASARDITAQKRLELELRDQQSYNRSLIESSVDALMTVDPSGIITDVNEQTVKLTGFNRKQVINSSFTEYFTDPELAQVGVRKTFDQGFVTNYELVLRTRSGRKVPVSFNAAVFRDTKGEVLGILASARDNTPQKQLEADLREQQTYARGLIESNIDALMTTDPLGIITDVNKQMCLVTGGTREELIGTPFKQYFTDPRRAEDGVRKVLIEGRVTNYELTLLGKDGKEMVVSYNATTFQNTVGQLRGVFAAARDITEQKRLEEQLRRKNEELEEQNRRVQGANRLKSEFLANMSHELRSPLNGIIGFTELMYDGKVGPTPQTHKEYLGDILTSSRHLLQLINDVLDLAKVESGKMEFQSEPLLLEKVAGEVCDTLRTVAAQKQIRVEIEVDPNLVGIMADQSKLKQVLYNYLSNSLKFTPNLGKVVLRFRPEGAESFRIEVEDTGIGIQAKDLGRLFTEFQQLDSSTAKKYQGTGLGLALIKRIVEAQGGQVGVRSTVDKGSTFFAVLPRVFSKTSVPATLLVDEPGKRNGRGNGHYQANKLLVIEDDSNDRAWLTSALTRQGYHVECAATGSEAVLLCQEQNYRAITLDFFLPDMTGRDVLGAIRMGGRNQQTPVILLSVTKDKKLVAGFKIHDILSKPFSADELFTSLEHAGVKPRGPINKVLVVDDDPAVLKTLEIRLREQGYEPICVPDGASALEAVELQRPNAIVLDLFMPEMDGFEVIDRLRASSVGRDLPVIVFTNKDLNAEEQRRLRGLAQGTVLKSGGEGNLLQELEAIMAKPNGTCPAGEPTKEKEHVYGR